MLKNKIILNFFKFVLKIISIEAIDTVLNISLIFLNKTYQSLAKGKYDINEAKKIIYYFKKIGNFNFEYLKKKFGYTGFYNYDKNTVFSSKNTYIIAHEAAHATSIFNKNILKYSYIILFAMKPIAYITVLINSKTINSYLGKYSTILTNNINKTTKIATILVLVEEAQASIRSIYVIKDKIGNIQAIEAAKLMFIGYCTYVINIFKGIVVLPKICKIAL